MFSSFWLALAGVMDSVFVGNGIGAEGLSAISLGQPVYLFYNILSYGFSIGGSIHYAGRLAEGRAEEGNRLFLTILRFLLMLYIITVCLGLLFLPQLMMSAEAAEAEEPSSVAFNAGADLRVRQELMDNVPGLPGGGLLQRAAGGPYRNHMRYRFRAWGELTAAENWRLYMRITDEFR